MKEARKKKIDKNKIAFSIILGCVIGIVIGVYGWFMNVSPLYVGLFSGATTGCCIVILLENENIKMLKFLGAGK